MQRKLYISIRLRAIDQLFMLFIFNQSLHRGLDTCFHTKFAFSGSLKNLQAMKNLKIYDPDPERSFSRTAMKYRGKMGKPRIMQQITSRTLPPLIQHLVMVLPSFLCSFRLIHYNTRENTNEILRVTTSTNACELTE